MKHVEHHRSPYTPAHFELVVDVERYPEFLPWVVRARIFRRKDETIWTDMTMGTTLIHKRFTTVALLDRPHRVEIKSSDPMFERFEQIWTFQPSDEGGTHIEYQVDVRLRSPLLHALIGVSFAGSAETMVNAYIRRARQLYGSTHQRTATQPLLK